MGESIRARNQVLESRAQPPSLDTLATQKEIRQERRELENLQNQVNAKRENIAQREEESKRMHEKLADEIIDAANERGESVKKREDTHRMAEANKAFSHYRW